jgi:hypothetical protein
LVAAAVAVETAVVVAVPEHPDWHPVPQWAGVFPHQPYCEQHAPSAQVPQMEPPF